MQQRVQNVFCCNGCAIIIVAAQRDNLFALGFPEFRICRPEDGDELGANSRADVHDAGVVTNIGLGLREHGGELPQGNIFEYDGCER